MIDIARKLHKNIEFHVMSAVKLDFESGKFDLVYADLVLHYLKDMGPAMKEAYRVLRPGGRLIFSNTHPIYDILVRKNEGPNTHSELFGYINRKGKYEVIGNYFKQGIKRGEWFKGYIVKLYKKTFSQLIMDSLNAGFVIKSVLEPEPLKSLKKVNPECYKKLSKVPQAIIIELPKPRNKLAIRVQIPASAKYQI
jgi:ubiquinone/menaquinone biosynthesis C-methylase UbiE